MKRVHLVKPTRDIVVHKLKRRRTGGEYLNSINRYSTGVLYLTYREGASRRTLFTIWPPHPWIIDQSDQNNIKERRTTIYVIKPQLNVQSVYFYPARQSINNSFFTSREDIMSLQFLSQNSNHKVNIPTYSIRNYTYYSYGAEPQQNTHIDALLTCRLTPQVDIIQLSSDLVFGSRKYYISTPDPLISAYFVNDSDLYRW